jgi:hypothetical protein
MSVHPLVLIGRQLSDSGSCSARSIRAADAHVTRYRFALISQELEQMSVVFVCLLVSGELHTELDEPYGKIELRTCADSSALDEFIHGRETRS